jgi:hypothetical protein
MAREVLYLRLPSDLKKDISIAALADGVSVNAFIQRVLEGWHVGYRNRRRVQAAMVRNKLKRMQAEIASSQFRTAIGVGDYRRKDA